METIEVNNRYQSKTRGKAKRAMRARLTSREKEILYYVAKGNTNRQIASRMQIREQTVKNRMSTILLKLNAIDRVHAIFVAIRSGLI